MTPAVLDSRRLEAKRARAARLGDDQFLRQRAFEDCLDRLPFLPGVVSHALIVGDPEEGWVDAIKPFAERVDCVPLGDLEPENADLICTVAALDHSYDPALACFILRQALRPGGRLIGATTGSQSLPRMRRAFLDAERAMGKAARRFHPMLDPAGLSAMLANAGFADVVIDVDSLRVRYSGMPDLVRDLRAMGCTNSLSGSVAPLKLAVYRHACELFSAGQERIDEGFEILHFSGVAKNAV